MCELTYESSLNPRLAGDMFSFRDNDAPTNRTIIKGCPNRLKVVRKPIVVRLESGRSVETEMLSVKVAVSLRLIPSYDFEFAGLDQSGNKFVARKLQCITLSSCSHSP